MNALPVKAKIGGQTLIQLVKLILLAGWQSVTPGLTFLSSTYSMGFTPACVPAVDKNSDGRLDLMCANFGSGGGKTLTVLTNNGRGGDGP
jgi:hypothetical protein